MRTIRKRRFSEIDDSRSERRDFGVTRRNSEGDRWSRDQRARDRYTRDRDQRTQDHQVRDSASVSPKRRKTAVETGEVRRAEDTGKEREVEPLGYKALEDISKSNSPESAIVDLWNKRERFEALLTSTGREIRLGLMQLVIHALHLCCSTESVRQFSDDLLRLVIKTNFLQLHLTGFISRMLSFSSKKEFRPSRVISSLADVFLEMLKRFGLEIVHSLPIAQLKDTFEDLKNNNLQLETDALEQRILQVKALQKEVIRQELESMHRQEDQSELEPPNNFRDVSIIPQAEDLSVGSKPFLRVNVVKRRYKDLEHYLDVQFRLLREDCVSPLREGIMQLRKDYGGLGTSGGNGSKKTKEVYVYRDVTVLYPVCSRKGMVYRIRFDSFHHVVRRVNWEKSKRLKFGSLLCLSADDLYTLLFATVENRDSNELFRGELEVRFEGVELEHLNRFIESKVKFDMVESPTFFEAYRHVLEALKEIEPDGIPFQEHIVNCSRNVKPPDHERTTNGNYDMSGIVQDDWDPTVGQFAADDSVPNSARPYSEDGSMISTDRSMISDDYNMDTSNGSASSDFRVILNIYDLRQHRESLEFNDSQLRAFQMALTKRFAVIQGPPGTGKTYVGLKIANVLLQTSSLWEDEEERAPILMVSYTNHALDQFLEGLLPMMGIVRVGGRSKSEKLKPYSIKFIREQARESKETPGRIARARTKTRKKMREINENGQLELSTTVLKCLRRGVLSYQVLKQFMSESHKEWFESDARKSAIEMFCEWLGVERRVTRKEAADSGNNVFANEDFQMQVSLRNFANEDDVEDGEENSGITPSEVIICEVEEAQKPSELRRNLQDEETMSEGDEKQTFFLQGITKQQRWKLYRLWLKRAEKYYLQQVQSNQPDYEKALARLNELIQEEDFHVLQKARVIGMTTTCAARYRRILQRISPKIVLVEEAAEVLEAHIITSLTKGCQHLILIGDHQQLRPNPAVYELAKRYKLDVSLFERMVNVGIPCERLCVQHRMRPEIAALMKHIYKDLENHESVKKYEDIKGIRKNMFFVNHSHLETHNDESHSHTNQHEAKFLVSLCRYLFQQGYSAEQITLLTTYTGQMFAIRDCLQEENDEKLKGIRLTTVDNFQGEENDIILLSLVRSNKNEKVGFIKIVNRACVALSRAKKGFYCIGNFDLLSKHSEIWSKIVADLKASGSIGNALPLVCQIHHEEVTVETAEDFSEKVPDGGCLQRCELRLPCGHVYKFFCHPKDPEHEKYLCKEECPNTIKGCSHRCPKLCYQECETDCFELVEKMLPRCDHTQRVRCGMDVYRVQCKERCKKLLPKCGHRCQARCCAPCTTKCTELAERSDWPCGHLATIACSATPADCSVSCGAKLECGHLCQGKCGECRMGRLHKRCRLRCGRLLVCSHPCKEFCTTSCPPCSTKCENRCLHSRCSKTCGELCVSCAEKCVWTCPHHKCSKPCGQLCDRPRCDEPCKRILSCGRKNDPHSCRGLCGEPCICAVCKRNDGRDPITEIFLGGEDEEDAVFIQLPDCKHIFAVTDLDRYMDISHDGSTDGQVIQLKSCPRCKTAIRRSLRYGNVIKQQLLNIEEVKKKVHGDENEIKVTKERLKRRLIVYKKQFDGENEKKEWERLERSVSRMSKGVMAAVTENQVTLMLRYCLMNQKLKHKLLNEFARCKDKVEIYFKELDYLKRRLMSERVSERELRDVNLEFTRLDLQLELCLLNHDVTRLNLTLDEPSTHVMREVRDNLSSGKLIEAKRLDELLEKLAAIRDIYPALVPLTPVEKQQIVSAVGVKRGSWYKCPKGHIYAIGECGGAMEKSTCPECGAVIGGADHRLEEGNELAPEMDGARHAAWSEQANLRNYAIFDEANQNNFN